MIAFRRTRLAPSPTGALHLGHARTFLITWWMARQAGAQILMRMEDLDVGRAKPESVQQAYDDLHWLGMEWDPWRPSQHEESALGEVAQSHRLPYYRHALQQLWEQRAIYPCTCTRAEIVATVSASVGAPHETDAQVAYPGTCATLAETYRDVPSSEEVESLVHKTSGKKVCWRLRVPPGPIAFIDHIAGPQSFDVAAGCGDFPLTRFDGTPAYQLACVVDDHAMEIDMVIRGDDLLSSTPRQILLYRALGWQPPQFAHVPLVIGPDGKRLAKRHGESRIAQFRACGLSPERIVGWAAWRSGQTPAPVEQRAPDLLPRFDLRRLPPERIVLNAEDLAWLA